MLLWLRVEGVRNLESQTISLAHGLVLVHGANAQGKSSLLEAAYFVATTKSYRTQDAREIIRHESPLAAVGAGLRDAKDASLQLAASVARERGEKHLRVGECPAKLREYLGFLPALALSGDSVPSIAGSPAERRRFIDRATAAAHPEHLQDLGDFRKTLAQRNRLLRDGASDKALEPWDTLFVRVGESLAARREQQVAAWQSEFASWPDLFPEGKVAQLVYRRTPAGRLHERLLATRIEERRLGTTRSGPHRDDIEILVDGRNLLRFGSAGQVRAAFYALSLAQARHVRASRAGAAPLLILDDVDTELDARRLEALLRSAVGEAQVLAATSKPNLAGGLDAHRVRVDSGRVTPGE